MEVTHESSLSRGMEVVMQLEPRRPCAYVVG
jgi:hypothetical protein